MALSKQIELDNGVNLNYHVIHIVETTSATSAKVLLHGFTSKEYYIKAIQKDNLLNKQRDLVNEFTPLMEKEEPTKTEQKKLDKLQKQINDLADEIENTLDYESYVLGELIIEVNELENLSKEAVEKAFLNTKQFKLAKLVS